MMNKLIQQRPMDIKRRYALLLLSFFLIVYILPLGARNLLIPDETRYAEIPREMIATGDWVVPRLDGLRYFEKPPLGYWVNAGSILLFGENNFAVRLPSALAVGLSALLIYFMVDRVYRDRAKEDGFPAIPAVLIFLSCFEVFGVGNAALLDSVFSFFLTATIIAFYFASEEAPGSSAERWFLLLSGVSCGLAFLAKGFLAFAVPVLALAPYLVWQRRYFDLIRMAWLPLLVAVLLALPWGILIQLRAPDFWRFFFWHEHIRRFLAANAQHEASFWFFFMAAPGLFMPWIFMVPAAVLGLRKQLNAQGPQGRLIRLSLCWLALPFLFFSASRGKLLTYILPCFPPFAVLTAFGLSRTVARGKSRAFQWGTAGTGIFAALILVALIYLQIFGYEGFHPYSRPWKATMLANGLIFMAIFCFWAFHSHHKKTKVILFGLAPLLLFFLGHFIIPPLTLEAKAPGPFLERYRKGIGPHAVVISGESAIRAVCWYLKRSDVYVLGDPGELSYGLGYKDAKGRGLDLKSAARLIDRNRGKTVLIARVDNISRWRNQLPRPVFQADNGPQGYVLWKY